MKIQRHYIEVESFFDERHLSENPSNLTLDDLKNCALGKTLQKLFDAGFVNTRERYNTLDMIHFKYYADWWRWGCIDFFSYTPCTRVFYLASPLSWSKGSCVKTTVNDIIEMFK